MSHTGKSTLQHDPDNFIFPSKGLHICNLNIRHILPKIDEITLLSHKKCPDIIGLCESFLDKRHPNSLISIDAFDFILKDHTDVQNKSGDGLLLYYWHSINLRRRTDLEVSQIEITWVEVMLTNSKPFLFCSVCRPQNACATWIVLFHEELSLSQTTGLKYLVMEDINIDYKHCLNNKWANLTQLFDLFQLITEPTQNTDTSSTIIDHVYTTEPGNITECFLPQYAISYHYPLCFTRKINYKIPKKKKQHHPTVVLKKFDDAHFLSDLDTGLERFVASHHKGDEDFVALHSIIMKRLDKHAPVKRRRVKCNRLPEWYTSYIGVTRIQRDTCKRQQRWSKYKY